MEHSAEFANALLRLSKQPMPFGKYQGQWLTDVPVAYLLWFEKKGMPTGELGELMTLALELKRHGGIELVRKLRERQC